MTENYIEKSRQNEKAIFKDNKLCNKDSELFLVEKKKESNEYK